MGAYFREDLLSEGYLRLRFGSLFSGGLIIGRIFASEIWGAYFREDLLSEGYLRLRFGSLFSGGLIIGRIFASEIWELIFGRTYYQKDICV